MATTVLLALIVAARVSLGEDRDRDIVAYSLRRGGALHG